MHKLAKEVRGKCPETIWRALPWLIGLGAAIGFWSFFDNVIFGHMDFSLYYFGGLIERHGSYTDTPAIMHEAAKAHTVVAADGVYGSPTLVGLIFQPLSLLPMKTALIVFEVLSLAIMAVGVKRAAYDRWWPAWLGLALLSTSNVVAFALGNFAFVTTGLLLFAHGSFRDGKNKQGGIALAIAVACKLYPAFLLLPLILKKEKQALTWTLVPLSIMLAITSVALGFHDTFLAIKATLRVASIVHPWSDNDGIPGTILRATGNYPLSHWTARICLVLAAAVVVHQRRRTLSNLFVLTVVLLTLAQGISWNMYYGVTLLVLLAARTQLKNAWQWLGLALAYFLTNGAMLHPTYEIFGLPRGLPLTIGLTCLLAFSIVYLVNKPADQPANL